MQNNQEGWVRSNITTRHPFRVGVPLVASTAKKDVCDADGLEKSDVMDDESLRPLLLLSFPSAKHETPAAQGWCTAF